MSTRSKIKEKNCTKCFKMVKWQIWLKYLTKIWVKLSLEFNVTETTRIFSAEKGVNKIEFSIKRDPVGSENFKKEGSIPGKFPTTFKDGSASLVFRLEFVNSCSPYIYLLAGSSMPISFILSVIVYFKHIYSFTLKLITGT